MVKVPDIFSHGQLKLKPFPTTALYLLSEIVSGSATLVVRAEQLARI